MRTLTIPRVPSGMLAGFLATLVLSVLMLVQNASGLLPEFDVVRMLSELAGAPEARAIGWAMHFLIGVVLWVARSRCWSRACQAVRT